MAVTCVNGHSNLDGMSFCEECGAELTAVTDRPAPSPDQLGSSQSEETQSTEAPPSVVAEPNPAEPNEVQTLVPDLPPGSPIGTEMLPPSPAPIKESSLVAGAQTAFLEVAAGPSTGRRYPVPEPACTVGRWDMDSGSFPEVDLTDVDVDAQISRKHFRITKGPDGYSVEDLGSLNGTSLNRSPRLVPGDQRPLKTGDELIAGRLFLKFVID